MFAAGEKLLCRMHDGESRECEVIERRELASGESEYYVHYLMHNRRLDEWIPAERLHPLEKKSPDSARKGSNADRKRKLITELHTPTSPYPDRDEEVAGELDAATQREHEAATRVKNIQRIVLGKWEMSTWCVCASTCHARTPAPARIHVARVSTWCAPPM